MNFHFHFIRKKNLLTLLFTIYYQEAADIPTNEGNMGVSNNASEKPNKSELDSDVSVSESTISHEGDDTVEQLRLQLATLTNSLSTLSAEKSKMEAGFQADKKKLRQDKEEVCC